MQKQKSYADSVALPKTWNDPVTGSTRYWSAPSFRADIACNLIATQSLNVSGYSNNVTYLHNPNCRNIDRYGWGDFLQFGLSDYELNKIYNLSWESEAEFNKIMNRLDIMYQLTPLSQPDPLSGWSWGIK